MRYALTAYERGDWAEAERVCRAVLGAKADHFDALHLLGVIAAQTQRTREGVELLGRAVAAYPNSAEAHSHLGVALGHLGRHAEALACAERAVALKPEYADAHYNRGVALGDLARYAEALKSYERAIALRADHAEAYNNRGIALAHFGRHAEALESYERAIALRPDYADAHHNRAAGLADVKRHAEAMESYERALQLKPDADFLYGDWLHARMHVCAWDDIDVYLGRLIEKIERHEKACQPFQALAMTSSAAIQRTAAETWVRDKCPPSQALPPVPRRPRGEKLRLGYFSADFRNHPVSLLAVGMFEHHDRSRFEVTAFSFGPETTDEMSSRVAAAFDRFVDVRDLADADVAALARKLGIDIAIDLGGFTQGNRTGIFAARAAPVQVSYLGYLGTMGAEYIDYLVADNVIIPPESRKHYAEKIAYLPSYQANDEGRAVADRQFTREELGLPPTGFVFCCFNNNYKITPVIFDVWMRILQKVEGSVLFLYAGTEQAAANLKKEAALRGVAANRLVFGERLPVPEYLARYRSADLFLDTLPYNAGTTASDALWAGLPVLTCAGEAFASRMAASLLHAIHLPELVTTTRDEYEALAVALATEPDRLEGVRQRLAHSRTTAPLFDTQRLTRHVEAAYTAMYERYQAGLPPEHIHVQPRDSDR